MDTEDIEKRLLASLKQILTTLYPNGKIEGGEFCIGDISGAQGKSLKVRLRDGVWSDFAEGTSGKIFKFFAERNGRDFKKGMDEIRSLLKIPRPPKQNKYKKPKQDWIGIKEEEAKDAITYLTKDRGIPRIVLIQSEVRATATEYVFTGSDEDNKTAYAQYTKLKRDSEGKKIIRFSPDGKSAKLVLWGMHTMTYLNTSGSVIITEGVIDAMSFRAADMFAVSIPSGVNQQDWIGHCWNWLSQFEKIYLCFDYDTAGQEQVQKIAGRLGIHRCFRVILPEKDANEVLLKEDGIQLLKNSIENAVDIAPAKRSTAKSVRNAVTQYISEGPLEERGDLLLGWKFPDTPEKPGLNFRFRKGEQTIWTGYTGGGKSTLLFQHAAYSMYCLNQSIAIASLEEPIEKVITTIITQGIGLFPDVDSKLFNDAYSFIESRLIVYNVLGKAKLEEVLEFFEYASKKDGVEHCIMDSLMRTDIDLEGDRTRVNEMILKVIESTTKIGAHYHIVAHAVKGDDEDYKEIPGVYSVKGIQELVANAHNVIAVWRNKCKEASIEGSISKNQQMEVDRKRREQPDTIIKICKNRNGKHLGQIKAWFSTHNSRFRPEYDRRLDLPYFGGEGEDIP